MTKRHEQQIELEIQLYCNKAGKEAHIGTGDFVEGRDSNLLEGSLRQRTK